VTAEAGNIPEFHQWLDEENMLNFRDVKLDCPEKKKD